MSEDVPRDLVARMATDPDFAQQVRADAAGVAARYGLTSEQAEQLASLVSGDAGTGPSMLDARLSKSALFFGGDMQFEDLGLRGAADAHSMTSNTHFEDLGLRGADAHSLTSNTSFEDLGLREAADAPGLLGGLPAGHASADPVGLLCNGIDGADRVGFLCDGIDSNDRVGLLCDGIDSTDAAGIQDDTVHVAAFNCDGATPGGEAATPVAIQCNELNPAGIQADAVDPSALQFDAKDGSAPASAPVSLLTGKLVAPLTLDTGIVGPDSADVALGDGSVTPAQ